MVISRNIACIDSSLLQRTREYKTWKLHYVIVWSYVFLARSFYGVILGVIVCLYVSVPATWINMYTCILSRDSIFLQLLYSSPAWVNISSGILTTKNMNQLLAWMSYHLWCSWGTWSMRGVPLLNCGIVTLKRGMLHPHETAALIFPPFFRVQRSGIPLMLNLNLNLNLNFKKIYFEYTVNFIQLLG